MKTVMIVDDSRFMREELSHSLEGSEYNVTACCRDAEEAIRAYREAPADVVLMDIVLPGMDGIEATRNLAGMGASVIIISSLGYDDAMQSARHSGACSFLTKPFTREQLLDAMRQVCRADGPL